MKKIFITTAIDYVNGLPHLGHALEKIQADVLARYYRLLGYDVLLLTGTDENSLKNVRQAEKEEIEVKEYVDQQATKFKALGSVFNLSFDDFIRTTEKRHIKAAQKLWLACEKNIYKKQYKGLYCVGCEEFYKEKELINGLCPEHKTLPEQVEEENYFFALSKYQKEIKEVIEQQRVKIIPEGRKKEILSFIDQGLQDICISRSNKRARNWGIDVPNDNSQKMWCWFDALSNYISALGYGIDSDKFDQFWTKNNEIVHVIGKGISRFHAIYWIGILLCAELNLPSKIFIHGYITVNNQKMSKSIGNVENPFDLQQKYGTDPVRYFLLAGFSPIEDGDFSYEKFESKYNADLANGLGNLVSRITNLAKEKIKFTSKHEMPDDYKKAVEGFQFNKALEIIWQYIHDLDAEVEKKRPWELSKEELVTFLNKSFTSLSLIAFLLTPFLPETSDKIKDQLHQAEKINLFPRL